MHSSVRGLNNENDDDHVHEKFDVHSEPVKFPLTQVLSDNSAFRLGNEDNSSDTDDDELIVRSDTDDNELIVRRDQTARQKVLFIL